MTDTFAIEVTWHDDARPGLPSLVGPFTTRAEAERWGELNIPNGEWEIRPQAAP